MKKHMIQNVKTKFVAEHSVLHNKRNTQSGITLVALIITVIVLLVLATVSINLIINSGIINKTKSTVDKYSEEEIKEQIRLAYLELQTEKLYNPSVDEVQFLKTRFNETFGEENYELLIVGEGYLIVVGDIEYLIDKDGNVGDGNKVEESNIEYAGDLSKNGQYDGTTEETAYRITCIEDLVKWTNNANTYKSKFIKLENTIDFNSPASYKDAKAKTTDINGNGQIEALITELTTGKGFKPILSFSATFDGQNNEIKNIFENTTGSAGLFATAPSAIIRNLKVSGKITTALGGNFTGVSGIVGCSVSKIINCYNYCEIIQNNAGSSYRAAGGIVGCSASMVENCINYGKITSNGMAGGIVGFGEPKINSCKNFGEIIGKEYSSGILGGNHGDGASYYIYNSYNNGLVKSDNYAGGIVGKSNGGNKYIYNSFNSGSIKGDCIGGLIGYDYFNIPFIINSFNVGNLESTSTNKTGGLCYLTMGVPSDRLNNAYYLDDGKVNLAVASRNYKGTFLTRDYMQSQEFVDELNTYVNNYNEEHKNDEDFIELKRWKYNEGNYPTFE